MKRIFTIALSLGLSISSFAQVQRMVLAEEFTNASCGPCAAQNPTFNTLLDANTTKVVSLKYQTVWPGVDPMNAQNQTDVATRVTYYGVQGVPYAPLDGDTGLAPLNNYYYGAPHNIDQAAIDAKYNTSAHWTMALTHHLSSDLDSIYISCVVTPDATSPAIANLKLHIALIEKEINFLAPPGTNGETGFYNVMRKMYPNASGQSLNSANATGQFTYNVAVALPTYLYDLNNVGVVAFIQNDVHAGTAFPVQQAAISQPQALTLDGSADSFGVGSPVTCATTVNPVFTLKNTGATVLTSCDISYTLDNGTAQVFNWTGSLSPNATTVVNLPSVAVTSGSHTLTANITNINGVADNNSGNNQKTSVFNVIGSSIAGNVSQDFAATGFPYAGYVVVNNDGAATWTRVTTAGFNTPKNSAKMDFYNSPNGQIDEFWLPALDFTTFTATTKLKFKVAYAQYSAENDSLRVLASSNCGQTWTNVWEKSGSNLATAAPQTAAFTPATNAAWRDEAVDVTSFIGQSQVLMKFVASSNYGNNAYLDNINISQAAAIDASAGTVSLSQVGSGCSSDISTNVTITNQGTSTITSCVIQYTLDGGSPMTQNWTGSIAAGASDTAQLASVSVSSSGAHTISVTITTVNSAVDANPGDNIGTASITINSSSGSAPNLVSSSFVTNPLTATTNAWTVNNVDGDGPTWTYADTIGTGSPKGSMRMNFWQSNPIGRVDELICPPANFTGFANAKIDFKIAAAQYQDATTALTMDSLRLMLSKDCGSTWSSIWFKFGTELATVGVDTVLYIPASESEWRAESVSIPAAFLGQPSVMIKWKAITNWGNMCYIDDVNILTNVGIIDVTNNNSFSVYPNPFSGSATLKLNISEAKNVTLSIFDATGSLVSNENKGKLSAGENIINIDGANLSNGIYMMNVLVGNKLYTHKLSVVK